MHRIPIEIAFNKKSTKNLRDNLKKFALNDKIDNGRKTNLYL